MSQEIIIISKRAKKQIENAKEKGYTVIDVTSKGEYKQFSPFYPHGGIPIPGLKEKSQSVEGVWQGLKVFENHPIDKTKFDVKNMKNLKRTVRKYGKVLGHQYKDKVINYVTARKKIYIPAYNYVLENNLQDDVNKLKEIPKLALLDYDINEDIENTAKPLSHASLIKSYLSK